MVQPERRRAIPAILTAGLLFAGCGDASSSFSTGEAPPRYLAATPSLGTVRIIDIAGEPNTRELLARTLQGVVNRTEVRLYVVDTDDPENVAHQHWIDTYEADLGVVVEGAGTIDDALVAFAGELDGYYLTSADEPWTFDAATTAVAAGTDAVVVTAAEQGALDALGVPMLDSFVGRWADATSCYMDLAAQVGTLPSAGFAILQPTYHWLRDFAIQQGLVTIGGHPTEPEWVAVEAALARVPERTPIYGYPARDGNEELLAVNAISQAGAVLVPSDSTPNLSVHSAVRPPSIARPGPAAVDVDCAEAELNVVIAITDGDNLVLPVVRYATETYWFAPERGRIPIAWSISETVRTLTPGIIDYYARTVAPGDELVGMIGVGYAYGNELPNADWFYAASFDALRDLGFGVLWIFDPLASGMGEYSWQARATEASEHGLVGLLDGYYGPFVTAPRETRIGGVPVLRARNFYTDPPATIVESIQTLLARAKDQRPPVVFLSAGVWANHLDELVQALEPLEAEGVRFLNPSTGMRCIAP